LTPRRTPDLLEFAAEDRVAKLDLDSLRAGDELYLACEAAEGQMLLWLRVERQDAKGPWVQVHHWDDARHWQCLPGCYQLHGVKVSYLTHDDARPVTIEVAGVLHTEASPWVRYQLHPDQPLVSQRERYDREVRFGALLIHAMSFLPPEQLESADQW